MEDIADYLDSPELFVQNSSDYDEFKGIIKERIHAKITEINEMTEAEKKAYIDERHAIIVQAERNQDRMRESSPPAENSEAHTVSEIEWLRELQRRFSAGASTRPSVSSASFFSGSRSESRSDGEQNRDDGQQNLCRIIIQAIHYNNLDILNAILSSTERMSATTPRDGDRLQRRDIFASILPVQDSFAAIFPT